MCERVAGVISRRFFSNTMVVRPGGPVSPTLCSVTVLVVGRNLRCRATRGETEIPLRVTHGDERHGLHVLWDAQQFFNVVFPA